MAEYVEALLSEIELVGRIHGASCVDTVYLGGGTPALLYSEGIKSILERVNTCFNISPEAEVTIEANPGVFGAEKASQYLESGINRLSLGCQTTNDRLLKLIGRVHTSDDIVDGIETAKREGFRNISADLMYGLPSQTAADHLDAITFLCDMGVQHVSAYALTLSPGTELARLIGTGHLTPCCEDEEFEMYVRGSALLETNGYKRYEISNFAKAGFRSCHNLKYWYNMPYLGLGLGAHSSVPCDGGWIRYSNTEDLNEYGQYALAKTSPALHREEIGLEERLFESAMLGMRLTAGIDDCVFKRLNGIAFSDAFSSILGELLSEDWIRQEGRHFIPTVKALDFHTRLSLCFMQVTHADPI